MKVQLVRRIKELMKTEELNQSKLAQRIGVKQNTVSAWLLGKTEPSIVSLWALADYFQTDIDYIVGREEY